MFVCYVVVFFPFHFSFLFNVGLDCLTLNILENLGHYSFIYRIHLLNYLSHYLFIHSFFRSLIHPLYHFFIYSVTHLFIFSFTISESLKVIRGGLIFSAFLFYTVWLAFLILETCLKSYSSFVHLFIHSFIGSLNHLLFHSFIYSFNHSHLFIHVFIYYFRFLERFKRRFHHSFYNLYSGPRLPRPRNWFEDLQQHIHPSKKDKTLCRYCCHYCR